MIEKTVEAAAEGGAKRFASSAKTEFRRLIIKIFRDCANV
jgi:hypothetical protein